MKLFPSLSSIKFIFSLPFSLAASTLDSKGYYGGQIKIINNDDDYDSNEDYNQDASQNLPDKYIVELKEEGQEQIRNLAESEKNVKATPR